MITLSITTLCISAQSEPLFALCFALASTVWRRVNAAVRANKSPALPISVAPDFPASQGSRCYLEAPNPVSCTENMLPCSPAQRLLETR